MASHFNQADMSEVRSLYAVDLEIRLFKLRELGIHVHVGLGGDQMLLALHLIWVVEKLIYVGAIKARRSFSTADGASATFRNFGLDAHISD